MIREIHLNNWRSHADTVLKFGSGTNLIIGIMGSGKSSIMEGISFGLFGTFPSLESRKIKINDLFRYGSDKINIEIMVEWEGKKYRIIRTIVKKEKKHLTEAVLYEGEKLIEKGNKAVSQYVELLLHIDYELFTRAIYSEQNSIDYFLNLNPKKRKDEFDVLLGLDKFEKALSNLTTLINRKKNKKKGLELRFEDEKIEEYKKELEENMKKLEGVEKEEEKIKVEEKELKPKLEQSENKVLESTKKEKEKRELEEKETKLKTLVSSYEEQIKDKEINEEEINKQEEEQNGKKNELEEVKGKLEKNKKEFNEKNKILGLLENKLQRKIELEEKLEKTDGKGEKEIERLRLEEEKIGKELVKNEVEEGKTTQEIEEIIEVIKRIRSDRIDCPFCGTEMNKEKIEKIIEEKGRIGGELKNKLEELEEKIKIDKKELEKIKKEKRIMEESEEKKKIIHEELKKIEIKKEDIEQIKKEIKEFEGMVKELEEDREKKEKNISKIEFEIKEMKKLILMVKKLEEYGENLPGIIKKIKEIGFNKEEFEGEKKKLEELKIAFERVKNRLDSFGKEKEYLKKIIQSSLEKVEEIEKTKKQIEKMNKQEEELIVYKNILKEVQTSLRDELIESINIAMNEIWSIFYPYKDYKKIRIRVTENDYNFEVYDEEWKTLESVVSGGERACVALTLRVSLSTVLTPNISWLILDEPTHNLDQEAIRLLSETLQTKVPEIINQTFVITHEELLLGANFSTSYKLKRDKGSGESTKVELL